MQRIVSRFHATSTRTTGPSVASGQHHAVRRGRGRELRAAVPGLTALVVAVALCAPVATPVLAEQPRKPNSAAVDLPPVPPLDPSLNTDSGYGRLAAIVRDRTLVALRILFSLSDGDIIATDGPITAEESVESGALVQFPDLTLRAGTATGSPYLIAIGDLEVGATDTAGGGIEYLARINDPITIYASGKEIASLSFGKLTLNGESHPDSILLGNDTFVFEDMMLRVLDDVRSPLGVTIDEGTITARAEAADDGTLEGEATFDIQTLGVHRGDHESTIGLATFKGQTAYDGLPLDWLGLYEAVAQGGRLPNQQQIVGAMADLMMTHVLGRSDGTLEMTGLEVFISPTESVGIDRIGMEMEASEPLSGTPRGQMAMSLDGLRTKGPSLPVQVDLGALRMSVEGEGFDAARLRGFLGRYMSNLAPVIDLDEDEIEARMPEILEGMADDIASLVRDAALGQGESALSLSGLDIRERGRTVFGVETFDVTGGWVEDARGRLSGPSTLLLTGLEVNDPDSGPPVSVGRVLMDSMTEGFDLKSLREMMAQAIEAASTAGMIDDSAGNQVDPDQMMADLMQALSTVNENTAVAGGSINIAVDSIALGTEMNPMGGLESFTLDFDITPAEPGVEVSDAALSLSISGLDLGPMAAAAAPIDLIPTAASLALKGTDLPVPALSRLGLTEQMDPAGADARMEAELMRLLQSHGPTFSLDTLTVTAGGYGVDGSGQMVVSGMMPQQIQGTASLAVRGLDETMTLLQEQVRTNPALQQPLLALVALRGLGRTGAPGTHVYDLELSPEAGVLINGTPAAALMMGGPAGQQDGGMTAPPQTQGDDGPRKKP